MNKKTFTVFLGIDGVLKNSKSNDLDLECISNYKELLEYIKNQGFNVEVCLSSSWRHNELGKNHLKSLGIEWDYTTISKLSSYRCHEIKWTVEEKNLDPSYCIILDDEDLSHLSDELRSKHVQSNYYTDGFNRVLLSYSKFLVDDVVETIGLNK